MLYFNMQSTLFNQGIQQYGRKGATDSLMEGKNLFNNALNSYMASDHSDSKREETHWTVSKGSTTELHLTPSTDGN